MSKTKSTQDSGRSAKKQKVIVQRARVECQVLTESFNQDKLAFLLHDPEIRAELEKPPVEKPWKKKKKQSALKIASKYLEKSNDGQIVVTYYQKDKVGRRYAQGSLSMQSLERRIRHTIAYMIWLDLDMENAHAVIIEYLCFKDEFPTPALTDYNQNREARLQELGVSRDLGKRTMSSMLYGGFELYDNLPFKPQWIVILNSELAAIRYHFADSDAYQNFRTKTMERGKSTFNLTSKYLSFLASNIEDKILMEVYKFVGSPTECVLCFDGLQLRSDFDLDLPALNEHISEFMKFKINFVIKPMDKVFPIPENIPKYVAMICPPFDFKDPYTFLDLCKQFSERSFDSYTELDEELSQYYKRVVGRSVRSQGVYFKKLESGVNVSKNLKNSGFRMFYKDKKTSKCITIQGYLNTKMGCADFECKLDPRDVNPRNFNLWRGFKAQRTDAKPEGLEIMKAYIFEVICSNKEIVYKRVISWLAGLFTNLRSINKTALLLQSSPGCGKNTLTDFLCEVVGKQNQLEVTGIGSITQRFNSELYGKRLVVINEMSSIPAEFHSQFDKLKTFITDDRITVEPKGIEMYTIDNIGNYILMTNHKDAMSLEQGDRRYECIEVSDARVKDVAYWTNLRSKCFNNQEVADAFYTYLLDFEAESLFKILKSELRSDIQQASKFNTLKFLEAFIDNPQELKTRPMTPTVLYNKYIVWCSENGEKKPVNSCRFGLKLKESPKLIQKDGSGRNYEFLVFDARARAELAS